MPHRSYGLDRKMYDYMCRVSVREPEILGRLRAETARMPGAGMQIGPEQGQFMRFLVELIGARSYLELGTYTGYSALSVALALPPDGCVIACDINEITTEIARRYWREAGVEHKIELRLGPARETLAALCDEVPESFDLAFIDADKENYSTYYEQCLQLLRPHGLLLIDNVFWSGAVADLRHRDADTVAIRLLNEALHNDERVALSMLPVGDGLTLALKR